jgi:rsbT co-antagonist protein RsbR
MDELIEEKVWMSMGLLFNFSEYITENADVLSLEVVEEVLRKMEIDIPDREKKQAVAMYVAFLGFFADSLRNQNKELVPGGLIDWSKKNAARQAASGGNISEMLVRYPPTRETFTDTVTRIGLELGLSVQENTLIIKRINTMLDISLNETVFAFERLSEEYRRETQRELAALSAPIIPMRDGIVILPLIGDVDDYRANYIMEHVVPKVADMNVNYVIADYSGVLTINVDVAGRFYQIGKMFQLMGIHVITTGLRPELVQTAVNIGINVADFETFATVKKALESIH